MSESDLQYRKLLELFRVEAAEHLDIMNQVLLQIETRTTIGTQREALDELFRAAHSLKGAARTVQAHEIEQIAHHIESVFDLIRKNAVVLDPRMADVLYDGLDAIQGLITGTKLDVEPILLALKDLKSNEELASNSNALATVDAQSPTHSPVPDESLSINSRSNIEVASDTTIRVPIARIDALMTDVSNLLVARMNIEQRADELSTVRQQYQQWQQRWRRFHTHYIRLLRNTEQTFDMTGQLNDLEPLLQFLQETQQYMRIAGRSISNVEQALHNDSLSLGLTTDTLQRHVREVRLLPFETITNVLQRTVRDLARDLGKEILLQLVGTRTELDKQVLDALKDPLVHILRNAVDHGVETPDERVGKGKPRQGVIIVSLVQRGTKVHILISDDGQGIDIDKVRRRASDIGLVENEVLQQLPENDVMELLLQPGMSTSTKVSAISGRGVGLDVVRQHIQRLQGDVQIRSTPDKGTTFEIIVPVSLSTLHCMLLQIGDEVYAVPTNVVRRVLRIDDVQQYYVKGQPMISVDETPMSLVYLADILERPIVNAADEVDMLVVVISAADRLQAFLVNDIISEQEIVVRSLSKELIRVRNISGATLLADGRVVLILNPNDLVRSVSRGTIRQSSQRVLASTSTIHDAPRRILVVDDSITTRTLQKNILEAAGYHVITATHGVQALEILSNESVSLVLSDVEMPLMNGFELTERIRQLPSLQHLPVILVTSLDSAEHQERGMRAGADAYIPKGVFDQNRLLETINRLL